MNTFRLFHPNPIQHRLGQTLRSIWSNLLHLQPGFGRTNRQLDAEPAIRTRGTRAATGALIQTPKRLSQPLRVFQVHTKGAGPGQSHLRMSGRMADVCAELDRLALAEAKRHSQSPSLTRH